MPARHDFKWSEKTVTTKQTQKTKKLAAKIQLEKVRKVWFNLAPSAW
jgi:hypothetical protein